MEQPSVDPAEFGPRLYLAGSPAGLSVDTVEHLPALLQIVEPAAFRLRAGGRELAEDLLQSCRRICAERSVAFLIEDDLDLARRIGADGLHLTDPGGVGAARRALGSSRILGADGGTSRHAAMTAGDDGADYVAFGRAGEGVDADLLELIGWWRDLFVLPCLAFAGSPEDVASLAAAGADFVAIGHIWEAPEGPVEAARALRAALDGA